jgi:hypothetical protein
MKAFCELEISFPSTDLSLLAKTLEMIYVYSRIEARSTYILFIVLSYALVVLYFYFLFFIVWGVEVMVNCARFLPCYPENTEMVLGTRWKVGLDDLD